MKWVNFSEKKPETNDFVLMLTDNGNMTVGGVSVAGSVFIGNPFIGWEWMKDCDIESITHWMPLPEPPQCEQ